MDLGNRLHYYYYCVADDSNIPNTFGFGPFPRIINIIIIINRIDTINNIVARVSFELVRSRLSRLNKTLTTKFRVRGHSIAVRPRTARRTETARVFYTAHPPYDIRRRLAIISTNSFVLQLNNMRIYVYIYNDC